VDGYIAFGVAEYRLFYWALLQKRPMIVRSLLWEAKWMGTLHLELQNIVSFIGLFCKRDLLLQYHLRWEAKWMGTLHLECHSISISNYNLIGLFRRERDKRDTENWIHD